MNGSSPQDARAAMVFVAAGKRFGFFMTFPSLNGKATNALQHATPKSKLNGRVGCDCGAAAVQGRGFAPPR